MWLSAMTSRTKTILLIISQVVWKNPQGQLNDSKYCWLMIKLNFHKGKHKVTLGPFKLADTMFTFE